MNRQGHWQFVLATAVALAAAAVPWFSTYPPVTDLPQHLAQIASLESVLGGHGGGMIMTPWYYPNTLVYLPLYVLWKIFDPALVGRSILSLILFISIAASYALASARRRPIENWLLSTTLIFNVSLYWGFLPFLFGWPFICLYLVLAGKADGHRNAFALTAVALFVYFSHSLWFLMLNAWVFVLWIDRPSVARLRMFVPLLPAWALTAVWYPSLSAMRKATTETAAFWHTFGAERFAPEAFTDAALGGIHGDLEGAILIVICIWMGVGIVQNRRSLAECIDRPLLIAGLLMLLAYLILPNAYMNTIVFNKRWLSFSLVLLLIALPAPRIPGVPQRVFGVIGLACFLALWLSTCKAWHDFDREDTVGFDEVLAGVKRGHRVLGLDFQRGSMNVKGRPTLHFFAYAEALRGASLSFSFAEHYSGIVQYQGVRPKAWKRGLVFDSALASIDDVRHFDRVIMSGDQMQHRVWSGRLQLEAVGSGDGNWRLYRPRTSSPADGRLADR